jgi:hypothetical protein
MKSISVVLHQVRVLATGIGGGHTYLAGRTDHPPHGIVDAYAYFDFEDPTREDDFKSRYAGGDVEATSSSWEYLPSVGLSLQNISWRNVDHAPTPGV